MAFELRRGHEAGVDVLWLRGELDHDTVGRFEVAVDGVGPGAVVVVDLGAVTLCDSSGLSGLVRLAQALAARGGALRLSAVPAATVKTIGITGLDRLIPVFPDVPSAVRADARGPVEEDGPGRLPAPSG
ncbi:STAS domain-containing protein [Actinosynnema sp. NPDC053489]|uniref:STAS domain-containing protein n=1 Tax=Actinosynnema sp. NPDC053489 TaxID=3363916 RepID=UPI0037C7FA12